MVFLALLCRLQGRRLGDRFLSVRPLRFIQVYLHGGGGSGGLRACGLLLSLNRRRRGATFNWLGFAFAQFPFGGELAAVGNGKLRVFLTHGFFQSSFVTLPGTESHMTLVRQAGVGFS